MRKFLGVVIAVAVLAAGGYYFVPQVREFVDGLRDDTPTVAAAPAASTATLDCSLETVAPVNVDIGVVIDPTASTASSFSQDVVNEVALQLSEYVPPKPEYPEDGVNAVNAINVTIKQVGDNPYAYGAAHLAVKIPGVSGLPKRPDVTCIEGGTYQEWGALQELWSAQYDQALATLGDAVERIKTMPLRQEFSGIRAALSALVVALPPGDRASYLVASDFEENRAVQTAGQLNGSPLILIAACPTGDASKCSGDASAFGTWATDSLGAGPVSVYRPEQMSAAIDALFGEASS